MKNDFKDLREALKALKEKETWHLDYSAATIVNEQGKEVMKVRYFGDLSHSNLDKILFLAAANPKTIQALLDELDCYKHTPCRYYQGD